MAMYRRLTQYCPTPLVRPQFTIVLPTHVFSRRSSQTPITQRAFSIGHSSQKHRTTRRHQSSLQSLTQQNPQLAPKLRTLHTTSSNMASQQQNKDWSASQYLKFSNERTRPVHDLLSQVTPHMISPTPTIYDLGCGPGNSTSALLSAFPTATLTGIDTSPSMLQKARATLPATTFLQADISTFTLSPSTDLLFSNAAFHWLRSASRIPCLTTLFTALKPGALLAIQVPDNHAAPSHRLMRKVATMPGKPWSAAFAHANVGDETDPSRPDLDPIEAPERFYDALSPLARHVNVWRTEYMHVLPDHGAIVEWVRGTGLQPFLQRIGDEDVRRAFLTEYEERLRGEYAALVDGKVLLGYPRLFVVAVRG